ncbi:MAG: hypothetical protein HS122_19320 [Opitutaceae bacterium]|nr:hypothetical protein [Opitutaceae bacterium]
MQQQQITSSILDEKLALVSVNIGIYAGYRRATRETIKQLGGNLPDCNAVTEGSIKVFPNEALKEFQTVRRALFRKIGAKGVKAMGSGNLFAVPKDALPEIEQAIKEAEADFDAELVNLDRDYDAIFERHVAGNPTAETILRGLKVAKPDALAKMRFGTSLFRINPVVREGEDPAKGIEGIVAGLARRLFEEVAATMTETAESEAIKKGRAGQKTLRPIKAAVAKMRGLEFLDPRLVGGAVGFIGEILSGLPQEGYIEDVGQDDAFSRLAKLVEALSDADDLINAASRHANGQPAKDILFPAPAVPAPQPEMQSARIEEQAKAGIPAKPATRPVPAMTRPGGIPLPKLPMAPAAPRVRAPARLI